MLMSMCECKRHWVVNLYFYHSCALCERISDAEHIKAGVGCVTSTCFFLQFAPSTYDAHHMIESLLVPFDT